MKAFAITLVAALFAVNLAASENLLPQRVLYIGQRASDFEPFLKQYFVGVKSVSRDDFKVSQARDYDVVLLDWPQTGTEHGAWLGPCPLGQRDEWNKPTV